MEFCMRIANKAILNTIREEKNNNILISPASFNIVLNMAASGSGGKTLEQFLRFLGSKSVAQLNSNTKSLMALTDQPPLSLVNAVFIDKSFTLKSSFTKLVRNVYKTEARSVNFNEVEALIEKLNSWAKYNTKGMISEFLPPTVKILQPPLLLANAIHFKAAWEKPFKASETRNEDFHLLDRKTSVSVPFMVETSRREYYGSFEDFKVIRLFCRGNTLRKQFCMDIILPHKRDGLQDVIEKFNSNPKLLQEDFELDTKRVDELWIPKWKFSNDLVATELMKELGLTLPFSFPDADITEMIESPLSDLLYIKEIFQRSVIEVNEEGAAAAAVTCAMLYYGCARSPPERITFIADHPFMFMIKEIVSGAVIFTGAVLNPLSTT
ncbi:hypothetical protein FNV43_RR15400 [Rhamnella rubrinervis]|uniref:Serpin domain-containing protein n=1 Tax=Rhamnella rubrinervis TaxID=2594499 RepID=A0A8K0E3B8_9ROSA|nr:hypothetical protein FNV43_RR15400 [Rhamnella rubrinervis]